ncbi:class I adenylate-forming enzyme family protein [Euzebya sp.]|uniref:class I adenylate-forming enzyme family protein n=1 Tax=Euzebya sp. TaxID=1971409 RepID=UPI00351770B2
MTGPPARQVPDLLLHGASRTPRRPCIVAGARRITFAEADERADRLAAALRAGGVQPGDRVALLAYNEPEYVEIRVGVHRAGAVFVPLSYRYDDAGLVAVLADATPAAVILGRGMDLPSSAPAVPLVWRLDDDDQQTGYEVVLERARPAASPPFIDASAPGAIMYTSGTTGRPKGAVLSHWALHAGIVAMAHEMAARNDSTYLAAMPLFHIGSQVGYAFTYVGATSVVLPRFKTGPVIDALRGHGITHTQMVPTMLNMLLEEGQVTPADAGSLQRIMYGAAPMPPALLRRAMERLGCDFLNVYGMTEALGISALRPEEHDPRGRPELLRSVGRDGIGMQTAVVDPDGVPVPPGTTGEVVVRGPALLDRYHRNEAATAAALQDGWLRTGDLGHRDDDGYLYLTDRKDDMIITGGENVHPSEVENVLHEHPDVYEAVVVGVPDDRWGSAVCAVVVPREGVVLDEASLIDFCRAGLPGHKVPKQVRISATLPRTASGKVLRRQVLADLAVGDR